MEQQITMHPIDDIAEDEKASRLQKNIQKQTKRNVYLALGGILGILLLAILLGPTLLIGLGLLAGGPITEDTQRPQEIQIAYLQPPVLQETFDVTNSASITLQGKAAQGTKVILYNNNEQKQTTLTDAAGKFSFTNVTLKEGKNEFKTKITTDTQGESDYSNTVQVLYLNKNPTLELSTPEDGQKFSMAQSPISVKGKTDPEVIVTVNEFRSIVDAEGNFTYLYNLKDGDNPLMIEARDKAGNTTKKEIKIHKE